MEILDQLAKFVQQLLVISLPILAAFVAAFLVAKTKEALSNIDNNGLAYTLRNAAQFAVNAAEQYLKSEAGAAKKAYALEVAQRYLLAHGVKLDLTLIADAIEAAVFTELNQGRVKIDAKE
jgi:hypothetical protein